MLFFKQIIISSFLVVASVIATTVDVNTGNSNGNDGTKVNVQRSSSVVNILPASLSIVAIAAMYIV